MTLCAQSDVNNFIKGGELLLSGLSVLKSSKAEVKDSKVIEQFCIKNKLASGVTVKLSGQDADGNDVKKELVVPKDGKECVFRIPKGVYLYEVILDSKVVYRKGEYYFDSDVTMVIKED